MAGSKLCFVAKFFVRGKRFAFWVQTVLRLPLFKRGPSVNAFTDWPRRLHFLHNGVTLCENGLVKILFGFQILCENNKIVADNQVFRVFMESIYAWASDGLFQRRAEIYTTCTSAFL